MTELHDPYQETVRQLAMRAIENRKTDLEPIEQLRAATAKVMFGTSDQEIALILGVSNVARVNEGIKEVLAPLGLSKPGYRDKNGSTTP